MSEVVSTHLNKLLLLDLRVSARYSDDSNKASRKSSRFCVIYDLIILVPRHRMILTRLTINPSETTAHALAA